MGLMIGKWGSDYVAVRTGMPGSGSMLFGVDGTRDRAIDAMKVTPIEAHADVDLVLQWAEIDPSEVEWLDEDDA